MRIQQLSFLALLPALIGAALGAQAQTTPSTFAIQRVAVPAVYTPGQVIDVTVTITETGTATPAALGIKDTVPGTWALQTFVAADPAMRPAVGRDILNEDGTRNIEFAYINMPAFPAMFTYRVKTGATDAGQLNISGRAIYRFTGAEEQSAIVNTPVNANASSTEGETTDTTGCSGCAGCNQSTKNFGVTLGDLFVSALALMSLLALSHRRG